MAGHTLFVSPVPTQDSGQGLELSAFEEAWMSNISIRLGESGLTLAARPTVYFSFDCLLGIFKDLRGCISQSQRILYLLTG
jgi:hypothetical protein